MPSVCCVSVQRLRISSSYHSGDVSVPQGVNRNELDQLLCSHPKGMASEHIAYAQEMILVTAVVEESSEAIAQIKTLVNLQAHGEV